MINPDAVPTRGTCLECGDEIPMMYAVMLCNECLNEALPEHPCYECGKLSKTHPRMTRFYGGGWQNPDGSLKPPRYYCENCDPDEEVSILDTVTA